jgi:starch synthase (maltosyl-transferring)
MRSSGQTPLICDTVLVVCTLDSRAPQEGTASLDMPALGAEWNDELRVHDEITGETYEWGQYNYVRLEPLRNVAHVFRVERTATAAG